MIEPTLAAPEHWVRQVALATMPPLNPLGGPMEEQTDGHVAMIRQQLDAVWAHAFHAGATWRAAWPPTVVQVEVMPRVAG